MLFHPLVRFDEKRVAAEVYGRYMWMLRRWRDECCCARTALIERWLFDTGAAVR
ncbi:hypothetical protein [Nocardia aobensis]|uniref:hypothetical protein n=1 Tax=Nocardia aobensis TaxID=257277 RepID=UPI0012F6E1EF|nr:hypothetical protein [Nocardia aobensis]